MTQTEGATTTFESKTSADQMSGHSMSGSSGHVPTGRGSSSTSPSPPHSEDRQTNQTSDSAVVEMGSTDSAGSARGGGPSCGLVSSLFPSSCRGRAEAFARRLHRRLTSLGSEDDSPDRAANANKPRETSWLHPSSGNRVASTNNATANRLSNVLQCQPRHSSESDLFYDFEIELENGPDSPAEEATAAELEHLLVNPESLKANHHDACHCPSRESRSTFAEGAHHDPESNCVFVSPINGTPPDSDSSEAFFDPESSDAEKTKSDIFFDPVTTSDSEAASNHSNDSTPKRDKSVSNCRRTDKNPEFCEDTSESSCSSRRNAASCENRHRQEECSSEDSLNGRSSQETTSASHESLWSTFDDSTVSLQDESLPRINCDTVAPHNRLPKSHSDSELPLNGISTVISDELDRRDQREEDIEDVDDVDFVNGTLEDTRAQKDMRNGRHCTEDDPVDDAEDSTNEEESTESTESKMPSPKDPSFFKSDDTAASDTDTDHSTYSSTINIPGALTFECPTGVRITESTLKNEVNLQIENGAVLNDTDEEKMCLLLTKLGNSSTLKEDDSSPDQENQSEVVEEEEERPQRIRRCSSLKTGKTPPGTPGRKKIVRFADVLGLDLADVRTFLDEIPKVPNSAYSDLIYDDIFQKDSSPVNTVSNTGWNDRYSDDSRRGSATAMSRKLDRMLVPLFQQPGGMANFLDVVRERRVCLENVLVQDPVTLSIQGTVRVINLDFHKSVHIRYTLNSWHNFSDLQATYVPNSCDGFSDKFSFVLYCHTLPIGQRLEFAVRFHCKGTQYWDNNAGANYCFQCLPTSSPVGYIPITVTESQRSEWSPMFY